MKLENARLQGLLEGERRIVEVERERAAATDAKTPAVGFFQGIFMEALICTVSQGCRGQAIDRVS